MTLIGFIHRLNRFSQPDAKNGVSWPCATDHAGHYLWPEVGPTTVNRVAAARVILSDGRERSIFAPKAHLHSSAKDGPRVPWFLSVRGFDTSLRTPEHPK